MKKTLKPIGCKRVGIVIVNWNSGVQLRNCVDSINASIDVSRFEIVVVDNDSQDESMELIQGIDYVKKIYAGFNLGFGRACNVGAKELETDFVLFLNPDAAVQPYTIHRVLRFMDSPNASRVGICGVQLLEENGQVARSCARLPTPLSFFYHAVGLSKIKRFFQYGSRMAEWDHQDSRSVEQLIGAFFFVRRQLFVTLGGFDERYFVYFEEVDFSLRSRKAGWSSFYLSSVQAFHAGGGTSNQVKAKRLFYSLRSRLLYCHKHFSKTELMLVVFTTFFLELMSRLLLAAAKFSWTSFKETISAYSMLIKWFCIGKNLHSDQAKI